MKSKPKVGSSQRVRADALEAFDAVMDTPEYRHLDVHRPTIKEAFEKRLAKVEIELGPLEKSLSEATASSRRLPVQVLSLVRAFSRPPLLAPTVTLLAAVPAAVFVADRQGWDWAGLGPQRIFQLCLLFVVMTMLISFRELAPFPNRRLEAAQNQYRAELERVVGESIRLVINEVYRGSGILLFPTYTPALVDLNPSVIVQSAPLRYVSHFVRTHQTSAIGVAGPRGAGKSSLLRAICERPDDDQISVCVSAPVHYEGVDFTRRLVLEATRKLLDANGGVPEADAATRGRIVRALMAFVTGVLLMVVDGSWRPDLGPVGVAGGAFVLYSLAAAVDGAARSRGDRLRKRPLYVRLAAELYDAIEWEREQSDTSKTAVSLGAGLFGAEDEASVLRRRRGRSHPDLVAGLNEVLIEYSRHPDVPRLVIAVDELDKLSETTDLVAAVNGIKDLFHMPKVHFLVSVSTDALARFEQRGLPARDAFDSAFDTIVRVGRLAAEDSVRVVHERANAFPRPLAMFCHAWAGGLARDLLRTARSCVEVQREGESTLAAAEIVAAVVASDLEAVADSVLEAGTPATSAAGPERRDAEAEALLGLKELTVLVRTGAVGEKDALAEVERLEAQARTLAEVAAIMKIGLAALFFFRSAVLWETEKEEKKHDVVAIADSIAQAVASIPLPRPARERAVQQALDACGLRAALR